MKRIFILFLLVLAFTACKKDKEKTYYAIGIDVQSDFMNDSVRVWLDDQLVINKRLETFAPLGVCLDGGTADLSRVGGKHTIKAAIITPFVTNGLEAATKTETFNLTADHYIGVKFNRSTNEMTFQHSGEPFVYD